MNKFCPRDLRLTKEDSDLFFDALDVDKNGRIDKDEMIAYVC